MDVDGKGHDPGECSRHKAMDEGSGGGSYDDAIGPIIMGRCTF